MPSRADNVTITQKIIQDNTLIMGIVYTRSRHKILKMRQKKNIKTQIKSYGVVIGKIKACFTYTLKRKSKCSYFKNSELNKT